MVDWWQGSLVRRVASFPSRAGGADGGRFCRASDVLLHRRQRGHDAALTVLNGLAQALAKALSRRFFLTRVMACWADSSCWVW